MKGKREKEKTSKRVFTKVVVIFIFIVLIVIGVYFAYIMLFNRNIFQDVTVEIGSSIPEKGSFLIEEKYANDIEMITDLSNIDINKVGDYEVKLSYKNNENKVILHLVDTTSPEVTFQDVFKNIDYEIDPKDFIKEMSDLSELTVEVENIPDISEYGEYKVNVLVKDSSGNITSGECNLIINWLKTNFTLELGDKLEKSDLVDLKTDVDKIDQKDIDKINKSPVGEYKIEIKLNGKTYTSTVKVQDTKAPTLTLKNVTIYKGENKKITKDSFITKAEDASGKVTTTLKSTINTEKIGTQKIEIEAVDKNNNKVTKTAKLIVKEDTVGPVISGLSDKTVNKHSSVNYTKGVSAVDAVDGKVTFTVDSSNVNIDKAGTYYATYTSKDSKGNTTTRKRKITVNHDQEDTDAKFNEFYNKNLAGKDALEIVETIRSKISYSSSWGGSDPIWYGLTNKSGNCAVHAKLVQKALTKAGYSNELIWTKDKTHYWNLVNVGGKWRHYDATPGGHLIGPATDTEKYESNSMKHRDWDRTKWPKAE